MSSGSIQITRLGTIVLGVWNGTPIDRAYVTGLLYTDISGLATVAHSGAYGDLSGTPSLAAIATSGSANDLASGNVPAARMPALTGDVTTSAGAVATTIAANAVTLAKMATQADQTILGNNSGGTHVPIALTAAQVKTVLAIAYTDVSGLAAVAHSGAYSDLSGTPSIPAAANPSGTIGLTAVNGSAATFMRSDGAPALGVGIAPNWTGSHTWTPSSGTTALTINSNDNSSFPDLSITGSFNGGILAQITNSSSGTAATAELVMSNGTHVGALEMLGVNNTEGEYFGIGTNSQGIRFGASGGVMTGKITYISSVAKITILGPVAGAQVDLTPDTGTFTVTATGITGSPTGTATWVRVGNLVTLALPAIGGTSNATSFTLTGLPSAIQPATLNTQDVAVVGSNNSVNGLLLQLQISKTSGTLVFLFNGSTTGFTATGTKGFSTTTVSYLLT